MNEEMRLKYGELIRAKKKSFESAKHWAQLKLEFTSSLSKAKDQMLLADEHMVQVERELKTLGSIYRLDVD